MKKKLFAFMTACMLTFALAACGNTGSNAEESTIPEPDTTETPAVETKSKAETEESAPDAGHQDLGYPDTAAGLPVQHGRAGHDTDRPSQDQHFPEAGQRGACGADTQGSRIYERAVWGNRVHFCG